MHRRWLLGLFGGLCLLTLLSITSIYLAYGSDLTSFADEALNVSATSVTGTVTEVEESSLSLGERPWLRIYFEFSDLLGMPHRGHSLLRDSDFAVGGRCRVEFLQSDPSTNRLAGTNRQIQAPVLDLVLGWLLLPGTILFLVWLQGIIRLRSLLRDGNSTTATVTGLRPCAWINPAQLRVDFEFRDHGGALHKGWHWVSRRGALGRKLVDEDFEHPEVIFDEHNPSMCRLVGTGSFRQT
jgi:hypothetical protein